MIKFIKTRYQYDSYIDFFRLAELSGFETIYVDELDVSQDGVYITAPVNGEWRPHIDNQSKKARNAHLILWNLERPSGTGSVRQYAKDNRELLYDRYFDEIWVGDPRLADETELRYVTVGCHPELGYQGNSKIYDVTHQSYAVPRRQRIYSAFQKIGQNCWPPERNEVLSLSKFGLCVHQDNHPFQEPLRLALFCSYGLPMVCEKVYNRWPWPADLVEFVEYDNIISRLQKMLSDDYPYWFDMGKKLKEFMCENFHFGNVVKEAVGQSVGDWR